MAKGPLAVRFLDWELEPPQAGALGTARIELENTGTVQWRNGIRLGYHWLDERGNPLVWDGRRTEIPHLAPGERGTVEACVRAPIPPGRYRLAFDLVAELRAWFAELGNAVLETTVDVAERRGEAHVDLPDGVTPSADWQARVDAAHAEGYAVVSGAIDWQGGLLRPRPRALEAYRPGAGRIPSFPHPLLYPSAPDGIELTRVADVAGLPAYAAPADEPWIYDGRIVVSVRP